MAKEKPPVQIQFDSNGNLPWRVRSWQNNQPAVDNYEFEDTLRFERFVRTNGSHYVVWKSNSNRKEYSMPMDEFERILEKFVIKLGYIRGKWTFRKRNQCQGIRLMSSSKFDILQEQS